MRIRTPDVIDLASDDRAIPQRFIGSASAWCQSAIAAPRDSHPETWLSFMPWNVPYGERELHSQAAGNEVCEVAPWRRRFIEGGVEALLQDTPRSGRTPSVTAEVESVIVKTTLHDKPEAATPPARGVAVVPAPDLIERRTPKHLLLHPGLEDIGSLVFA